MWNDNIERREEGTGVLILRIRSVLNIIDIMNQVDSNCEQSIAIEKGREGDVRRDGGGGEKEKKREDAEEE